MFAGGTLFGAGSKKGDSLWLFSTNGTIESLPIPAGRPMALLTAAPNPHNVRVRCPGPR